MLDIHQLDNVNGDEIDGVEEKLDEYIDTLLEQFLTSAEGEALLQDFPDAGFWSSQMVDCGYNYLAVPLPGLQRQDVETIVLEIFPEKISLLGPEDADGAIEEMVAFWQYLKREYQLKQADGILEFLKKVAPQFVQTMTDPANFGPAKSLVTIAQQAGFDMSSEEGVDAFMNFFKSTMAGNQAALPAEDLDHMRDLYPGMSGSPHSDTYRRTAGSSTGKTNKAKRKKRKAANASRKRNRKK